MLSASYKIIFIGFINFVEMGGFEPPCNEGLRKCLRGVVHFRGLWHKE